MRLRQSRPSADSNEPGWTMPPVKIVIYAFSRRTDPVSEGGGEISRYKICSVYKCSHTRYVFLDRRNCRFIRARPITLRIIPPTMKTVPRRPIVTTTGTMRERWGTVQFKVSGVPTATVGFLIGLDGVWCVVNYLRQRTPTRPVNSPFASSYT